jgi:WD40 repeat protein
MTFNSTGDLLVTSDFEGNLFAWDTTGDTIRSEPVTWQDKGGRIESVVIDPGTRFLITGGLEGVRMWRFDGTTIKVRELSGDIGYVTRVGMNTRADVIAAEGYEGRTMCWLADDDFSIPIQLDAGDAWLPLLPFHPDGSFLLTSGRTEPRISIWDIHNLRRRAAPTVLRGDDRVRQALFLPTGMPASLSQAGTLRVWPRSHAQPVVVHAPANGINLNHCALSREAKVVVGPGERVTRGRDLDRRAKLVDVASGEALVFDPFPQGVNHVAVSADGMRIALGGEREIEVVTRNGSPRRLSCSHLVDCVALSPDGRLLAAVCGARVLVWDLAHDDEPASSGAGEAREAGVLELHFDPDGAHLAGRDNLGSVYVWRLVDHALSLRRALKFDVAQEQVALTAGGAKLIALGGGSLNIFDLTAEETAPTKLALETKARNIRASCAFNVAATRVVAATDVSSVARYWDLGDDGRSPRMIELRGHDGNIWDVAMTADGDRLATASDDGTVRLWSTDTAQSVVLQVPLGQPWRVAFRGNRLLSASNAGLCSWLLNVDDVIALAEDTASRNLTPDEWARFLPGPWRPTFPRVAGQAGRGEWGK